MCSRLRNATYTLRPQPIGCVRRSDLAGIRHQEGRRPDDPPGKTILKAFSPDDPGGRNFEKAFWRDDPPFKKSLKGGSSFHPRGKIFLKAFLSHDPGGGPSRKLSRPIIHVERRTRKLSHATIHLSKRTRKEYSRVVRKCGSRSASGRC